MKYRDIFLYCKKKLKSGPSENCLADFWTSVLVKALKINLLYQTVKNAEVQKSAKAGSLLEHSCAILNSFKIVVIFNNTSPDFVLISTDVLLKMTTILKEM